MSRLCPAVVAVFTLVLAVAPSEAATRGCGRMEFAANSDFVATNIRATNTTCKMARRVVSQTIRRNDRTPLGYTCTAIEVDSEGLAYSNYRCAKGRAIVRWRQY